MRARDLLLSEYPEMAQFLADLRHFLESRWRARAAEMGLQPGVLSEGTCGFTSYVLKEALVDRFGGEWSVQGGTPAHEDGSPRSTGGMLDLDGRWHGHYWVVDQNEEFAIDLAADQFGHGRIEIRLADDPVYDANYARSEVDEHMRNVRWRAAEWLSAWRDQAPGIAPTP